MNSGALGSQRQVELRIEVQPGLVQGEFKASHSYVVRLWLSKQTNKQTNRNKGVYEMMKRSQPSGPGSDHNFSDVLPEAKTQKKKRGFLK